MTWRRRLGYAAGAVLVALVLAQLVGPPLAENRVRGELEDRGEVSDVSVSAFPAVKLLLMKADEVRVHFSSLQLGTGDIGEQIERSRDAGEVRVTVDDGVLGPLRLRDLEYVKDGDAVTGRASVTSDDLEQALLGIDVEPVASADGELVLRASAFGVSADARLSAEDGALKIAPDGLAGAFVDLTVFEDPAVDITAVSAARTANGFTLTAQGALP